MWLSPSETCRLGKRLKRKGRKDLREEMINHMIRVINGEKTRAEANGMDVFTIMTVHPPF